MNTKFKSYKLPKTLVLDYKKWRCGYCINDGITSHGSGFIELLNEEGYMCCLGQFSLQSGLSKNKIKCKNTPADLSCEIDGLNYKKFNSRDKDYSDTSLSKKCISINDNMHTISQKVIDLIEVLSPRKLKLKNFPKSILDELSEMGIKYVVEKSRKKNTKKVSSASSRKNR